VTPGLEVIRVLIADDHAVVREGIRRVLGTEADFEIVGEAVNGSDAVSLTRELEPDVIILDLSMPELSGFEAAERIRSTAAATRILILSIHDHEEYVARSIRAGAHGYLRKDSSPAELRAAVRSIGQGNSYFAKPEARALFANMDSNTLSPQPGGFAELTSREREVLSEIARGRSNKEIAAQFSISVRTVESHRETLMRKLGIRGTAALTRFAIAHGLPGQEPG
jgi:two-component system, NarL family, nitrate/nitrite response regulator NarL